MATAAHRIPYEACPLCGSLAIRPLLKANWSTHPLYAKARDWLPPEIVWCGCAPCDHVFTDGYFTDEAAARLFEQSNEGQIVGQDYERQRLVAARMIDRVLPFAESGLWVDIGFGNGALLMTAHEYGFRPFGCDLRAANVEALKAVGIEAERADITALQVPEPCAVISMADVLEHMPFPKDGLAAARERLRPGGVLLISMPNSESMLWRLLNGAQANPYWGEVEHYHNFSRARLYALLREMGFEPVRYGVSERYRACMEVIARKP